MSSIGYLYRGNNTENGGHLFVLEKSPEVRAIHLHAIFDSDPQWSDYLQFRDILRSNADLRGKYADLKSHLATAFPGDRKKYTAGKASFIKAALSGKSH
ncbi:hypothetical protein AB838_04725 [Rhodobacteraceae bacterium (ex Bugula neritina AB1)]|nr:hypothetical protein AB838_04725 [Rhodobacteraceae bacterium (ex Bugula neritina AB1)]